jgi:hypothetical protein
MGAILAKAVEQGGSFPHGAVAEASSEYLKCHSEAWKEE